MRIGILGGTFDPPHVGHLALARAAFDQLKLDEVVFLPASKNPLKAAKAQTSSKHRLAMLDLMLKGEPHMAYSDMEITRGGTSYAVDTMSELQAVRPAEYWFIMGADALRHVPEWKSTPRLMKLCRLGVSVRRPLNVSELLLKLPEEFKDRVDIISMTPTDVSSTEIRDRMSLGKPNSQWLTPEVLQYTQANKLYQNA